MSSIHYCCYNPFLTNRQWLRWQWDNTSWLYGPLENMQDLNNQKSCWPMGALCCFSGPLGCNRHVYIQNSHQHTHKHTLHLIDFIGIISSYNMTHACWARKGSFLSSNTPFVFQSSHPDQFFRSISFLSQRVPPLFSHFYPSKIHFSS